MYPNIAFFDSGQGGLTIWEKIVKLFPHLNTIYLGDNARCPYGSKSPETIIEYSKQAGHFLANQQAELLAIVCGTASSVATETLKKELHIPVIGIVEDLCLYAASMLRDHTRPVAVLATHYTIQSQKFQTELKKYNIHRIWPKACPLFVPLVEDGIADGPMVEYACDLYLHDIPQDTKVVLLACTHYPRIANSIAQYLTKKTNRSVVLKTLSGDELLTKTAFHDDPIYLLEASLPMSQSLKFFIDQFKNRASLEGGKHRLLCTDAPVHFSKVAAHFTHLSLPQPEFIDIVKHT